MSGDRGALVGRDRHLGEIGRLVEGLRDGRSNLVVLSGEAGAGKTRLAEEAAALAAGAGIEVAWATGWGSAAAPLSTWSDILAVIDPKAPQATISPAPTGEADPETARAMFVRSLVAQLRETLSGRRVLVIVDDVQWCDQLSLYAIEALVASLRSSPLALLVTVRDDGRSGLRQFAALTRVGRHLVVPPLTEVELGALAVEVTGHRLSQPTIARLHDRTAGNVLFATELLANAGPDALGGDRTASSVGSGAAAMFAGRLAELSTECRQLLGAASVVGRRFRLDVLAETIGVTGDSILPSLGEAHDARLVRDSGIGAYEFAHPLMAEACYDHVGLPRRVRLHRDVGEALERLRARGLAIPSAELAHHFAAAAAAGVPAKALRYATAAGRDSMHHLAYEDAARDFARALAALDLCPADDAARAELLLELGDAHAAAGDLPAARSAYETVVDVARPHGWHERLARAALAIGSGPGGFEVPAFDRDQIGLLEEAAEVAEGSQRAQVLARLSVALSLDADGDRRAHLSEAAVAAAREADDPLALGYALASWCDVVAGPADVERRLGATVEILDCASRAGDARLELLARRLRVVALLEAGATAEVDGEIAAFADRADRLGQVVYSWYVPLWRAMRAAMDGRLDVAYRSRREAARLGEAAHSENAAMLTGSHQAMVGCEIGDPAAFAFFEDVMVRWPGLATMARPALAYAYAAAGQTARAGEVLAGVIVEDYSIEELGSEWLPSVVMLSYAAALTSSEALGPRLYDTLLPFRARHAIDGIGCYDMGSVERALGMLAALSGHMAVSAAHFDAAVREHRRVGARLLVAGTLRDSGRFLDDAVQLEEARSLYSTLGVDGAADTTRGPVQAAGPTRAANVFRREGDVWLVGFHGTASRTRHTKGIHDIARLLAQAGTEVHALDLVSDGPTLRSEAPGDAIDNVARRQYRARLLEIEGDLAEADEQGAPALSARLVAEREALLAELAGAYGLGGRARRRGDSAERARSAVTQRIRDAIGRLEAGDPALGGHLRRSVRTGTFCSYLPEEPTTWEL